MRLAVATTAGLALGLAACVAATRSTAPESAHSGAAPATQPEASVNHCPVIASRDWSAWLDTMPDGGGKRLNISGEVDLPTPSYTASWAEGPADRAMPPSQRLRLTLTPPDGMVAQVVTPAAVRYAGKATYPAYRSIIVVCADTVLATIAEVPARD